MNRSKRHMSPDVAVSSKRAKSLNLKCSDCSHVTPKMPHDVRDFRRRGKSAKDRGILPCSQHQGGSKSIHREAAKLLTPSLDYLSTAAGSISDHRRRRIAIGPAQSSAGDCRTRSFLSVASRAIRIARIDPQLYTRGQVAGYRAVPNSSVMTKLSVETRLYAGVQFGMTISRERERRGGTVAGEPYIKRSPRQHGSLISFGKRAASRHRHR